MHPIDSEFTQERAICNLETIEIGAVALDGEYKECSSFKSYVRPAFCAGILPRYTEMTGISTAQVTSAPGFNEALDEFFKWCFSLGGEVCILAWSNSDRHQLMSEMKLKGYEADEAVRGLLGSWRDFQKEFAVLVKSPDTPSLERALDYAGLSFEGRMHDALTDARNTAKLVAMAGLEPEMLRESAYAKYRSEAGGCTLGELFNLEGLLTDADGT